MLHCPTANKLPHHRIAAETAGVFDVFIASQARGNRLPRQSSKAMPAILSGSGIGDVAHGQVSQAERVVKFAM